jgi:hypothetical protein
MTIKDENLRAINNYYFTEREQRAILFLEKATDKERARTLESHLLRPPSPEAQQHRENLDYLLRYYSVLELASQTHAIPDIPGETRETAKKYLNDTYVARYFEWYYPLLVPRLFRARVNGKLQVRLDTDETKVFLRFLELDMLRDDDDTGQFLDFLDDYTVWTDDEPHNLSTVLQVMVKPGRFLKSMSTAEDEQTPTDQGVRGLLNYLGFSRALHDVLESTEHRLLRSVFWHYHGYWYQRLGGQVLGALLTGIQALQEHVPANGGTAEEEDAVRATRDDMNAAARTLEKLTSSIYRIDLEQQWLDANSHATKRETAPPSYA